MGFTYLIILTMHGTGMHGKIMPGKGMHCNIASDFERIPNN